MGTEVQLRGTIRRSSGNIAGGQAIWVTPAALRPTYVTYYVAQGSGTATVNVQQQWTGNLEVKAAPTPVSSTWMALDGMRWWLE